MLGQRLIESLDDPVDPARGLLVGYLWGGWIGGFSVGRFSVGRMGQDNDHDGLVDMVKDDQLVVEAEIQVGEFSVIFGGVG